MNPSRIPITALRRTPEEKKDILLSWARPDLNFFSAGACHILAFVFLEVYPEANFRLRFICPKEGFSGNHVYVSNGEMAFDAQGYGLEQELLLIHQQALEAEQQDWQADVVEIQTPLAVFCKEHNHRPPEDFPFDVWQRAKQYLARFLAPV